MLLAIMVVAIAAFAVGAVGVLLWKGQGTTHHPRRPHTNPQHPAGVPPPVGIPTPTGTEECDVAWNPVCYEKTSYDNACHLRRSRGVTTGYTPGRCPGERQPSGCKAKSPSCMGQEAWDRYIYNERMKKDQECGCPSYVFKPVCGFYEVENLGVTDDIKFRYQRYDNSCLARCDGASGLTDGECPAE